MTAGEQMCYLLHREAFEEGEEAGMAKGKAEGKAESVFNLMNSLQMPFEHAASILKIPEEEFPFYRETIEKMA